ncbi:hypothetical protein [Pseudomonas typographi]|uniref:Glutamate 5-kinase n=1 Tax=Pseudomonas typographi TaxID=2715964 RepID=A0ABR7Z964_9PSED|nr:hypothetical protein [Pseudomonas typographi]MBD1554708.1 hypothetical protein [Pseudomonas typographi]MBD1602081.1 hypothetical protein [Pseudomonas typographi]
MGMRDEIQAELAEAFDDADGLADAVKPVAGSRKEAAVYDPATGQTTSTTTTYTGRGVFGSYSTQEIDGSLILATDEKLLVLQSELLILVDGVATDDPAEPKVGDLINDQRVINIGQDAAGATWSIQLRA